MKEENLEVAHVVRPAESSADMGISGEAAAASVATAEAAAALAHVNAAVAETAAAERVEEIEEEADAWKAATANQINELGAGLTLLHENVNSLRSLEEERHATRTQELDERLAAIEARLPPIIIESETPSTPEASNETPAEANPEHLAAVEASANLGPAATEAAVSLDGSGETRSNHASESSAPPGTTARRKRRWI